MSGSRLLFGFGNFFLCSNDILNSDDKNKHDHYRNLKTIEKTEEKIKTPHNPTTQKLLLNVFLIFLFIYI